MIETITLNKAEIELAKYCGHWRYYTARKMGVPDELVDENIDPIKNDISSMGAEIAYGKIRNIYPDLKTRYKPFEKRPIHDFIINGKTVDVKWTHWETGGLLVAEDLVKAGKVTDIYALFTGVFPEYKFWGEVPKEIILNRNNLGAKKGLRRKSYYMTQDDVQSHYLLLKAGIMIL